MTPQGLPSHTDLPAYTARLSLSRPNVREPVVHTYSLKDGRGRAWLILNVASRAPSPFCLPQLYEGEPVRGSVEVDLEKETQVKAVDIMVCIPSLRASWQCLTTSIDT